MLEEEQHLCNTCINKDVCDSWEAQFCCTLCQWQHEDIEPDCENCDPMDI